MKKLSVLYSFPLRIGISSIGMVSWHQVNELVKKEVNVYLSAGSLEKNIEGLSYLNQTFKIGDIKIPIKPFGYITASRIHDYITSRILQKNHRDIDVVHCWPLGSEVTLKTAKDLGIKTFLERPNAHTRFAFNVVKNEYDRLGIKQDRKHSHNYNARHLSIEEREYNLADYILCPSDFVAQTFKQLGFSENKMKYHHYGYDPSRYFPAKMKDQKRGMNIIFIGSCEPRKGLHFALEAWLQSKASKDGHFYICGNFVPGYKEFLDNKLKHPSISIMGFVNDLTTLLHRCDVLILPSIEEGSSLITTEAMACGNALIVSDASGAQCEHMIEGLTHRPGDIDAIVEHLNLLCDNKKLLEKLKKNCIEKSKKLTWEHAAEILISIYKNS